jgi:hypothetical protein
MLDGFGAQHQVREVDVPRMRRHVRALGHVTHVTQVTLVDHLRKGILVDVIDFAAGRRIDQIEQGWKGIAQIEAAAAAVANLEYPLELLVERSGIVEPGVLPAERMARRGPKTAFTA